MPRNVPLLALLLLGLLGCQHQPRPESVSADYVGALAPEPQGLLLKAGDRLALCGDSITEQKMYSRLVEAYVTAARPDLGVTVRQYGWSGEQAGGFLNRMDNDVLRFKPTIATTCYGMNDFRYVPQDEAIAQTYRQNQTAIVRKFQAAGVRVVLGSAGTIHSVPPWVKSAKGTWESLNLALLNFRNITIEVAAAEQCAFADVYWPMLVQGFESRAKYGDSFKLEGNDGVHPGWAGHVMMAAAYLKALGLDGNLGTIELDMEKREATARDGQRAVFANGTVFLRSERLPFAYEAGDVAKDSTIAAGVALSDFQQRFNRLIFKVSGVQGAQAKVTWGTDTKTFTAAELGRGINLAAEFPNSPLAVAFGKIWQAVGEKQAYETKQIKTIFRSKEAKADREAVAKSSQVEFERLAAALKMASAPVESQIKVEIVP